MERKNREKKTERKKQTERYDNGRDREAARLMLCYRFKIYQRSKIDNYKRYTIGIVSVDKRIPLQ